MIRESVETLFGARHRRSGAQMPGNKIYTLRQQERSLLFIAIYLEMYIGKFISGNACQEMYIRRYISRDGVAPRCQEIRSIHSDSWKGHWSVLRNFIRKYISGNAYQEIYIRRWSGAQMPGNKIYTLRQLERSLVFIAIYLKMYIGKFISGNVYQETEWRPDARK